MTGFSALSLGAPLARAVEVLGFTGMTPVQAHALPPILRGADVTAQARTGTGKTVAFGLGALSAIDVARSATQALVLCPTRELAEQVGGALRRLARFVPNFRIVTLCGGVPVRAQVASLRQPPHLVVGTPGRVLDHLRRATLDLGELKVLVLDEADRMLDLGFADAIADVVAQTPTARQTLLFSATFPDGIRAMSGRLQREPVQVTVDATPGPGIAQVFHEVAAEEKLDALTWLLHEHAPSSALVFCPTREDVDEVAIRLQARGFSALALHGGLDQRDRDEVLVRFVHRSCAVLVATDVAARGLDIAGLPAVIAWALPTDPDVHVHRVGRTGRAGEEGRAFALVSPSERGRAAALEQRHGPLRWEPLDLRGVASLPRPEPAPMVTLVIDGGRRDKLRAGDLLGALTRDVGLAAEDVGKIDVQLTRTWVAVRRVCAERALQGLQGGKIKGRRFRVKALR